MLKSNVYLLFMCSPYSQLAGKRRGLHLGGYIALSVAWYSYRLTSHLVRLGMGALGHFPAQVAQFYVSPSGWPPSHRPSDAAISGT